MHQMDLRSSLDGLGRGLRGLQVCLQLIPQEVHREVLKKDQRSLQPSLSGLKQVPMGRQLCLDFPLQVGHQVVHQ